MANFEDFKQSKKRKIELIFSIASKSTEKIRINVQMITLLCFKPHCKTVNITVFYRPKWGI